MGYCNLYVLIRAAVASLLIGLNGYIKQPIFLGVIYRAIGAA